MPHSTYFVQGCPTCGRRLHVRVEYLGKKIVCQHCRGQLVASDGARCGGGQAALLQRANELLQRAADRVQRERQSRPK
jgi:hypothetical protein